MTFVLFGIFCWSFAGFLASFQHWFKSFLFIFITGTCFENFSAIVLLKLFHLIGFFCMAVYWLLYNVESGVGNPGTDYKKRLHRSLRCDLLGSFSSISAWSFEKCFWWKHVLLKFEIYRYWAASLVRVKGLKHILNLMICEYLFNDI